MRLMQVTISFRKHILDFLTEIKQKFNVFVYSLCPKRLTKAVISVIDPYGKCL